MSWSISYSSQAQADVRVAFRYYKETSESLGKYFLSELKHAEKAILNAPEGFQIRFFDRVRGYPLKKFPFLILYVLVKESIFVLAVFNTNQNPNLIESRFTSE
jgi:hypothetical protein